MRALRGVRVDGQKLAEFLEPRMLLLVSGTDDAMLKACAAVVTTDGYCLTAAHVVQGEVRASPTVGEHAGAVATARVVWRSGEDGDDLALIHVPGLPLPEAFHLRRLDAMAVGARVVLGGYPGGAQRIAISGGEVTSVEVREAAASDGPGCVVLDHSAPGQQGDSGGPVIDADGRLVGVASGGYWSPFGGWEGIATLPDPTWLARRIAADRARRR